MAEYNVDEYKVEGEGAEYNFKIFLVDNKITLQLTEIATDKPGKNYEGEFTLDELRQINRVFQLTATIYDAQEEFKKAVERQKIALSENEAYVNIMFHMVLGTDNAPFVIALPRNESVRVMKLEQETDLLKLERDNLYDKIMIIKNNTSEIMKNVTELEDENKKLKDMTNQVIEEMKIDKIDKKARPSHPINNSDNMQLTNPDYSNQINNATAPINSVLSSGIKNVNFPCGIENDIIRNEIEIDFINRRLQNLFKRDVHYNLVFKGSRNGDKAIQFHSLCDRVGKSLVLIQDNFGNRFGGFTSRDWSGKCLQKMDDKAFIFSIEKGRIYNVLPNLPAIGCYPNCGPVFFGCQIRIFDNFFSKGGTTYLKGVNYATTQDYELTGGKQAFGIKELEVYEVL